MQRLLYLLAVLTVTAYADPAPVCTLHVDWHDARQLMDNFGASDCWSCQRIASWPEADKARLADLLFSKETGIGLSCWRFNIGAGPDFERYSSPWRNAECFETAPGVYDWSKQQSQQWFLAAAKARGVEQYVAFANSPPRRMTRNGHTNCDDGAGTTNLKAECVDEYAAFLADVVAHFATHPDPALRIAFDRLSPVNEPNWEWNADSQEGNRASNDDIKAILKAVAGALKERNLATQLLTPESGYLGHVRRGDVKMRAKYHADYGDYLNALCGDPEIAPLMGGVLCWHSYFVDKKPSLLVPQRTLLRNAIEAYPGWRFWQTEYCVMQGPEGNGGGGRDLGMDTALHVARIIHCDITRTNVSAWQWWTALSPCDFKDGLVYTDWQQEGDPVSILPTKTLWALGNFSRYIRPGSRRLGLVGGDVIEGLMASAYRTPDQGLAVVVVNVKDKDAQVRIELENTPSAQRWTAWETHITSAAPEDDLRAGKAVAWDGVAEIPARSVVTLVAGQGGAAN